MGYDIGLGHHPNGQEHVKTKDKQWACSDRCRRDYNMALSLTGGGSNVGGGHSAPQKHIDHEAMAAAKVKEAAANAEKARVDLLKAKHEDEMDLKRRQQELEEKRNKQKRADELRAQGKGIQALFVEHSNAIVGGFLFLSLGIFILYTVLDKKSTQKNGAEINLKLESIEDQVKLAILEGNKEKALELANKLVHPLHEDDESKEFDSWSGYPKYDEVWNKKRETYKEQIMNMGINSKKLTLGGGQSETIQSPKPNETQLESELSDNPSQPTNEIDDTGEQPLAGTINYSNLIGEWKGSFGNDELIINIESITEDGSVTGYNIVKNNKRPLTGVRNGDRFELKEPGDAKWDGVFSFTTSGNNATGIWKSNNGKLSKEFSLTK